MIDTWAGSGQRSRHVPGKWPAAALYVLLTLLLTYPLSLKPDRTVLAHYPDDELLMWVLAWDAHAFVHQPLSMFDANIFYPQRRTLAYSENLIGSAVFAAPVLWWTRNPVLALNVVALLACVLCGLGAYILGCRIGLSMPSALICGLIFAFSPARFFRTPQIHIATVQWIPFALASLHAYFDGSRKRDLRLAVAFFTLQALTTGHGAVFLVVAVSLLLAYGVVLGEPVAFLQRGRDLGVTGLLLLVPAVLVYLPYRLVQDQMGLRRGLDTGLSTPDSLLASPTHLHTWLLPYVTTRDILGGATAYLFVGYLPLALALTAILWGRRPVAKAEGQPPINAWTRVGFMLEIAALVTFVAASILTFRGPLRFRIGSVVIFSARGALRAWMVCAVIVGQRAAMAGRAPLTLLTRPGSRIEAFARWMAVRRRDPAVFYFVMTVVCVSFIVSSVSGLWQFGVWRFVYQLPGFSFIRAPTRFIVLAVLAIAVLAGIGVERLTAGLTLRIRRVMASIVAVLLVAEFAAVPLDVVPYRIDLPAADRWVARQSKPYVVAELPLFNPDQRYQTAYMLHATLHWQKTVHGYSGILPASHEVLYKELRNFPDEQSLQHLKQLGVTYVIAHTDRFPPNELARFEEGVRSFDAQLRLEFLEPAGRVYSLR
jgi:hypothetical protein